MSSFIRTGLWLAVGMLCTLLIVFDLPLRAALYYTALCLCAYALTYFLPRAKK